MKKLLSAIFVSILIIFSVAFSRDASDKTEYVLVIEIRERHLTLDVGTLIKDEMNKMTIEIPTTKRYYESVSVGQKLDSSFRTGSFLITGSLSDYRVKVKDKKIIRD